MMQNRDSQLETSGNPIGFYEREFYVLSNFSSFMVTYNDQEWMTAEHAYQAAKFFESAPELAKQIANTRSAHEAYKLAQEKNDLVPENWDEVKVDIMLEICQLKLEQHPYVRRKLLQTEKQHLVEDSPTDSFWGWGPDHNGRNELGKIWMRLRDEIQRETDEKEATN